MKVGEFEGFVEVFVVELMFFVVVFEGVWLVLVVGGFVWDVGLMCSCRS